MNDVVSIQATSSACQTIWAAVSAPRLIGVEEKSAESYVEAGPPRWQTLGEAYQLANPALYQSFSRLRGKVHYVSGAAGRPRHQSDPVYLAALHAAAVSFAADAAQGDGWFRPLPQKQVVFDFNDAVYSVDPRALLNYSGFTFRDPSYETNARHKYSPEWVMRAWLETYADQ